MTAFDASWEWRQGKAADIRRLEPDAPVMLGVDNIPPDHDGIAVSQQVDGEEPCHSLEYKHNPDMGQE